MIPKFVRQYVGHTFAAAEWRRHPSLSIANRWHQWGGYNPRKSFHTSIAYNITWQWQCIVRDSVENIGNRVASVLCKKYMKKMMENMPHVLPGAAADFIDRKRRCLWAERKCRLRDWLWHRSRDRWVDSFVKNKLLNSDVDIFNCFIRTTPDQFRKLLDTIMRDSISAHEKVSFSLCDMA